MRSARATASATSCVGREALRLPHVLDQSLHLDPGERIERAEWLVARQQPRMADQRAGECDTLLLPTRPHAGPVMVAAGETHLGERGGRKSFTFAAVARMRQPDSHVARHALPWQQARLLEHEPRAMAIDHDPAAVRHVEPRHQPQQRRLAATAAPDDGDECAGLDVEIDAAQHMMSAERPCQPAESHGCTGGTRARARVGDAVQNHCGHRHAFA